MSQNGGVDENCAGGLEQEGGVKDNPGKLEVPYNFDITEVRVPNQVIEEVILASQIKEITPEMFLAQLIGGSPQNYRLVGYGE